MVARALLASSLVATACTDSAAPVDEIQPTLEITSPERGTTSESTSITVTGRAIDNGPLTVTVNGQTVTPATDGTFSVTLEVVPGMSIIETHAIDAGGNDMRDVRAVLAGNLAPTDGSISSPVAARAGATALTAVGNTLATQAEAIDFTSAAQAMNPVYNNTGCLGARIDLTSVDLSNIDVALVPDTGTLTTDVEIDNVVVRAHANFKVACVGGSTNITVRASKARIHGDLGVTVSGAGNVRTSLAGTSVALDGFTVDVGGVPGAIESLLKGEVRKAVEKALVDVIKAQVPDFADTALAGLVTKPVAFDLLGNATSIGIAPAIVDLSPDGLFVSLDTTIAVAGGEGGVFVPMSAAASPALMDGSSDLGIALANDTINQLFAAMWATGSMEQNLDITAVGPLAALLDDDTKTLSVQFSLPPAVTTVGDTLGLAIGDMIVTGKDASGATVQKMAITITTTLSANPTQSGKLSLVTGAPAVKAQMVEQSDVVDRKLTGQQIEGIVSGAWGLVSSMADEALAKVPVPQVAGVTFAAPTIVARDGFVVANVSVE